MFADYFESAEAPTTDLAERRRQELADDLDCGLRRIRAYERCAALAEDRLGEAGYWRAEIGRECERIALLRRRMRQGGPESGVRLE